MECFYIVYTDETCAHFNHIYLIVLFGENSAVAQKHKTIGTRPITVCFYDQFKMNSWWLSRLTTQIAFVVTWARPTNVSLGSELKLREFFKTWKKAKF